jgi:hypothetical protein
VSLAGQFIVGAATARAVLTECLDRLGLVVPVRERVGDYPSPTILVDGLDVMTGAKRTPQLVRPLRVELPAHQVRRPGCRAVSDGGAFARHAARQPARTDASAGPGGPGRSRRRPGAGRRASCGPRRRCSSLMDAPDLLTQRRVGDRGLTGWQNAPVSVSAEDSPKARIVTALLRDGNRVLLCHRSPQRRWYPDSGICLVATWSPGNFLAWHLLESCERNWASTSRRRWVRPCKKFVPTRSRCKSG